MLASSFQNCNLKIQRFKFRDVQVLAALEKEGWQLEIAEVEARGKTRASIRVFSFDFCFLNTTPVLSCQG